MNHPYEDGSSKASVLGGMVLTLVSTVSSTDLVKTMVLSAVGAVISFAVPVVLQWLLRRWRR